MKGFPVLLNLKIESVIKINGDLVMSFVDQDSFSENKKQEAGLITDALKKGFPQIETSCCGRGICITGLCHGFSGIMSVWNRLRLAGVGIKSIDLAGEDERILAEISNSL